MAGTVPPPGSRRRRLALVAAAVAVLVVAPVVVLPRVLGGSGDGPATEHGVQLGEADRPVGLAVGGRPLFPLPASLAGLTGQRVRGETAVLAVASPAAFWVGMDDQQRLLVRPPAATGVAEGAPLVLEGTLRRLPPDFAGRFGVGPVDAELLRRQGHYIEATKVEPV